MKQRSLLAVILACIGILCGCTSGASLPVDAPSENPAYLRYPDTDWGMTPEAYFAALALPTEAFTRTETVEGGCAVTYYVGGSTDYFGETVTMKARFSALPYDSVQALRSVTLTYDFPLESKEFNAYCRKLYRLLKGQGAAIAPTEGRYPWDPLWQILYSEATTSSFPEETRQRLEAVYSRHAVEVSAYLGRSGLPDSQPLSQVQIICPPEEGRLLVLFSGDVIAVELRHLALYDTGG